MNSPLMTQIGQRVVAWHNRHPLARRVTLAHIHSIGVVALPFDRVDPAAQAEGNGTSDPAAAADAAPTGRLAALKKPLRALNALLGQLRLRLPRRRKAPPVSSDGRQAVFDEDFIGSLPEGEVRRWAEQHALRSRPGEDDWPQRDVPVARRWARDAADDGDAPPLSDARRAELNDLIVDLSDRPADAEPEPAAPPDGEASAAADDETAGPQIRWAVTAAIDVDGARRRLLLTNTAKPAILGRRAISPARLIAATALLSLLVAAAVALPWLKRVKAAQAANHAPAAASAASAGVAASKPVVAASGAASGASAALASAPAAAAASSASAHGHEAAASDAHGGHDGPSAAAAGAASAAASGAASSPTAAGSAHGHTDGPADAHAPADAKGARAPAVAAPAASVAPGPVFALVSRAAMSKAEPQVALQRMQDAAASLASTLPDTRTELVLQGGRWQAVWWPFRSRADATQARWALALKGVTVEVVEF